MKIVMLGIVGAGKGTQAERLSEYINVPHISTGDIFREASENKTDQGLEAKEIMKQGNLVPDNIVTGIVKDRLEQDDVKNGYILDGFPRTLSQAEEFEKIQGLNIVFYITVPQEEVIKRLSGRRTCIKCNTQYNKYLDEVGPSCHKCGGNITRREDDEEKTVKIRIQNYINQTEPLIQYYKDKNLLQEIDGTQNIEQVFNTIVKFV